MTQPKFPNAVEWPTLAMIGAMYGAWIVTTTATWPLWFSIPILAIILAFHSSLTHEVLHGHPTPWQPLNTALIRPGLGLAIPYGRFRDSHLAHHRDEILTDPYDDPETNFLDPAVWAGLPGLVKRLLRFNNTLLGRILLGPLIGTSLFYRGDLKAIAQGNRTVRNSWLAHGVALVPVVLWLASVTTLPIWAYLLAAYSGLSLIKIRTFLEHRAHRAARARTVVVEDRGPLAFLFLNNNFHVVHHMHTAAAWYKLPTLYFARPDYYLRRNDGYRYASYREVFKAYFVKTKDPVPHPLRDASPAPDRATSATPLRPVDAVLHPTPIAPQPLVKPDT